MKTLLRSVAAVFLLFVVFISFGCGDDFAAVEDQPAVAKAAFEILPAETEMVGSINFENSLVSEHLDQMPLSGAGEAAAQIENFLYSTGFDPAEDLNRAYLSVDMKGENASIVVYADIDRVKMQQYVESELGSEFEQSTIGNAIVFKSLKSDQKGHAAYFSVVNDEMILAASSRENMAGMLDRVENGGQALASNSNLMDMINRVQYPNGAWAVIPNFDMNEDFSKTREHAKDDDQLKVLEGLNAIGMLDNVVFSADLSDQNGMDFVIDAGVGDGYAASDVSSIIKGAISGAKAGATESAEAMDMLDQVRVSTSNGRVLVRGEFPENLTQRI